MKQFLLRFLIVIAVAFSAVQPSFANFDKGRPKKARKAARKEVTVYTTRTGSKYHSAGCSYLRYSSFAETKRDAIAEGYTACSRCNP